MFKKLNILKIASILIIGVSFLMLFGCNNNGEKKVEEKAKEPKTLFAYVGANLKEPVTEIANAYEQKTGVKVELTFNNAGSLLNQLETMKKGDIYMPGGMSFIDKAKEKGHIEDVAGPIAYHTPVIITPKGNPGNITSINDLTKEGVKLIIPDKEATAIGKTVFKIFNKLKIVSEVEKNILASVETPAKVLASIVMGQGNAGIVEYSNTFKEREKIEIIEIDPQVNETEEIPVALLKYSPDKEEAAEFIKFVKEEGPTIFGNYGFKIQR